MSIHIKTHFKADSDMPSAAFHTLGCRLNQAETALIANSFRDKGYKIVEINERPDVLVINSCTVTQSAEGKCRQMVRKTLRNSPDTYIAVVGCYSQVGWQTLQKIEGIDLIVGAQDKARVVEFINGAVKFSPARVVRSRIDKSPFSLETFSSERMSTRANLKIQDGCDFMCSYCLIPFARGRARSRNFSDITQEAKSLVKAGFRELVLTGVNIGAYRFEGKHFLDVVKSLLAIDGLNRLRISSIEPNAIPVELLDLMANSNVLCHHLHVPIQSGSERILKLMNRRHGSSEILAFLETAVSKVPDILLATDIIAGFPDEKREDFLQSRKFLEESPLAYAHVFSYSRRTGTAASRMSGEVPPEEIKRRSRELQKISQCKKLEFYRRFVGQTLRVLIEEQDEQGRWTGFSDNYLKVATERSLATNHIAHLKITEVKKGIALAE